MPRHSTLGLLLFALLIFMPAQLLATPSVVSVTPPTGSGLSQTFSFQYSDPNGWQNIAAADMWISGPGGTCYTMYDPTANALYLRNDSATGWLGPITLGTAGTEQNSLCSIDASKSSSAGTAGNTLIVNLAITFQPAAQNGEYTIYGSATDKEGNSSGHGQTIGSWEYQNRRTLCPRLSV